MVQRGSPNSLTNQGEVAVIAMATKSENILDCTSRACVCVCVCVYPSACECGYLSVSVWLPAGVQWQVHVTEKRARRRKRRVKSR